MKKKKLSEPVAETPYVKLAKVHLRGLKASKVRHDQLAQAFAGVAEQARRSEHAMATLRALSESIRTFMNPIAELAREVRPTKSKRRATSGSGAR